MALMATPYYTRVGAKGQESNRGVPRNCKKSIHGLYMGNSSQALWIRPYWGDGFHQYSIITGTVTNLPNIMSHKVRNWQLSNAKLLAFNAPLHPLMTTNSWNLKNCSLGKGKKKQGLNTELLFMEEIRRSPVEVGSLSHYLQGFIHPRWCRISSINSTCGLVSILTFGSTVSIRSI